MVKDTYGWHLGEELATNAERILRRWGIDPEELKAQPQVKGHNTRLFTLDDVLAVKVVTGLETHQRIPEADPLILQSLAFSTLGYDQGMVPIHLEIYPYLNTKDVEPRHVKAVCHALHERGLLFRDNKPDNIGLTRDGLPYILDGGSIIPIAQLPKGEPPFLYAEWSGHSASGTWDKEATSHSFHWPDRQQDVPEFFEAAELLRERKEAMAATGVVVKH